MARRGAGDDGDGWRPFGVASFFVAFRGARPGRRRVPISAPGSALIHSMGKQHVRQGLALIPILFI